MNYSHLETSNYTPDGISINGYDGVSICTGDNDRNERMRISNKGVMKVGTTIEPTYGYNAVFGPVNHDAITAKAGICIANGINNYCYIRHGDGNSLQIQMLQIKTIPLRRETQETLVSVHMVVG